MSINSLEQAIGLIEQGRLSEAQKILKRLIAADHHDLSAWFWFVETCTTKDQRINVLEICLEYNQDSEQVKQVLDKLRLLPLQELPIQSANLAQSSAIESKFANNLPVNKRKNYFSTISLGLAIFGAILGGGFVVAPIIPPFVVEPIISNEYLLKIALALPVLAIPIWITAIITGYIGTVKSNTNGIRDGTGFSMSGIFISGLGLLGAICFISLGILVIFGAAHD